MPRYLFKALDTATTPGPGPALMFPSLRSFSAIAAQLSISGGGPGFTVFFTSALEVTINGTDFRSVSTDINGSVSPGSNNGAIAHLAPIDLVMGMRLNLKTLSVDGGDSPTISVLLALEERE